MFRHLSRMKEVEGMQTINIDVHNKKENHIINSSNHPMEDATVALAI